MKFGRLLQDFDANRSSGAKRPRNNDHGEPSPSSPFIGYKRMKKVLKQANTAKEAGDHELMRQLEREFVDQLHVDLEEINSSFIEQEEEAVIKMQTLRDEYEAACKTRAAGRDVAEATWLSSPAVRSIRSRFADLHGELVLLLHWSVMNYAGTLKILKKHDKLLGGHSQQDLLGTILKMPFTSTASVAELASSAETYVKKLGDQTEVTLASTGEASMERANSLRELMDEAEKWAQEQDSGNTVLLGKTRAALDMLTQLQSSAHTPSTLNQVDVTTGARQTRTTSISA